MCAGRERERSVRERSIGRAREADTRFSTVRSQAQAYQLYSERDGLGWFCEERRGVVGGGRGGRHVQEG